LLAVVTPDGLRRPPSKLFRAFFRFSFFEKRVDRLADRRTDERIQNGIAMMMMGRREAHGVNVRRVVALPSSVTPLSS
jgi:hypothetical protein